MLITMDGGWKRCIWQHLVLAIAAYLLYWFFFWTKEGLPAGHQINRSWADASMVFLFLTLLVGTSQASKTSKSEVLAGDVM